MEDDRFVKCPLVDEMIEDIDCIENVDAVDGRLKADKLPERFKKKDDWETICKKCKWHNYRYHLLKHYEGCFRWT